MLVCGLLGRMRTMLARVLPERPPVEHLRTQGRHPPAALIRRHRPLPTAGSRLIRASFVISVALVRRDLHLRRLCAALVRRDLHLRRLAHHDRVGLGRLGAAAAGPRRKLLELGASPTRTLARTGEPREVREPRGRRVGLAAHPCCQRAGPVLRPRQRLIRAVERPVCARETASQLLSGPARHLCERQEPHQRPRRERAQDDQDESREHPRRPAGLVQRRSAQREHRDDRELREDQRDEQLHGTNRPDTARRPRERRECERHHQHDDVDGGLADQKLDPERDRRRGGQKSDEERKERGARERNQSARDRRKALEEVRAGVTRGRRHDHRHLVARREEQRCEWRRDPDRKQRQRQVAECRASQEREIGAHQRLDRRSEQERQRQDGRDRGHPPVCRREPG